jgi:hypothetical protein
MGGSNSVISQSVEWGGHEYSVKYSFRFIQQLKAAGLNVSRIYAEATRDPANSGVLIDDYAAVTFECLRAAGCPCTIEEVWEACKTDPGMAKASAELFMWLVQQHYATSKNAPSAKN